MSASKYQAGTKIAYVDTHTQKVVEDEIWLVRQGYYHMPNDDYLHDENIIGAVVDGKRVTNELFKQERQDTIARANRELEAAEEWATD
ncbi:hypothetical protein OIU34_23365 [Pararhizobium sp. BT-229]|uniref:hypothetical protein n=1 Tax=Pararhizobium sp. BT-229 TaxID=2986923 RepID=UPI0021F739BB|nr:hypothetical protein [Pararhizobium sp. BT-229]MCV9964836.1 hypothetical protein [Pararhizobium sp. BT-229]